MVCVNVKQNVDLEKACVVNINKGAYLVILPRLRGVTQSKWTEYNYRHRGRQPAGTQEEIRRGTGQQLVQSLKFRY